jgi:very-short-patch-repair endonuclease
MPRLLRESTYRARQLRQRSTAAERLLWESLRGRALEGAKFRRQHPIGPYVVDFYCLEARLVIEADGGHHLARRRRDRLRDAYLRRAGLTILRFSNDQILADTDAVIARIRSFLCSSS